jgi:hypothetical protein
VAGATPKVKDRLSGLNTRTLPEQVRCSRPETVLQAKTHGLVIAGAKDVVL